MRLVFNGLLLLFLLPLAGCDPGMTIRQARQQDRIHFSTAAPEPNGPTISVKTSHPIIHNDWYAPTVTVTNPLDTPITISGVELIAKGITYANKPRQPGAYPLAVDGGQTKSLDIWFDLRDDVWKTFLKQPAELRMYYRSGGSDHIAHTAVIGEHLNY